MKMKTRASHAPRPDQGRCPLSPPLPLRHSFLPVDQGAKTWRYPALVLKIRSVVAPASPIKLSQNAGCRSRQSELTGPSVRYFSLWSNLIKRRLAIGDCNHCGTDMQLPAHDRPLILLFNNGGAIEQQQVTQRIGIQFGQPLFTGPDHLLSHGFFRFNHFVNLLL